MGAYYQATIKRNDDTPVNYDTHQTDNGLKLMEHSYIGNNYVERIMSMLIDEPYPLSWVSDYSDEHEWNWDNATEASKEEFMKASYEPLDENYFVLNHDKNLYIDMHRLNKIEQTENPKSWPIHPIPILCNASNQALGGGDYYPDDSRRGIWDMNKIQVVFAAIDIPDSYKNVTEDCAFYE